MIPNTNGGNSYNSWWTYNWDAHSYKPYIDTTSVAPYGNITISYPQQGWECPKCHRVNSPVTSQCACYSYHNRPQCAMCQGEDGLIPHGSKHICRRCNLRLIDEAISETEARLANRD